MKLRQINSLRQLRESARLWDDLWYRSALALPTLRAELLAQWLEHFGRGKRFVALVVESNEQFLAALPLVESRKAGCLRLGQLPSNPWSASGDLLLDTRQHADSVLNVLVGGLDAVPWPALILDQVDLQSSRWEALAAALGHAGRLTASCDQYHVGVIDIDHDWQAYQGRWSSNHRHAVRKSKRRLEAEGDTRLIRLSRLDDDLLRRTLRTAFEIEDRSWKGQAGTSILRTRGMFDFILRQARQLDELGNCELLLLEHCGRPIAFEYCYVAKGSVFSHKIGYDPAYRQFGPGRLLRYLQLEEYFAEPQLSVFDTLGIMCPSKAKWCSRSYRLGRLVADTGSLSGKALMSGYQHVWPWVRRLRGTDTPLEPPKLGAVKTPGTLTHEPCGLEPAAHS